MKKLIGILSIMLLLVVGCNKEEAVEEVKAVEEVPAESAE